MVVTIVVTLLVILAVNLIIVGIMSEENRRENAIASMGASFIGILSLIVSDYWSRR